MNINDASFQEQLRQINWFHRIDLGNGIITPGIDDTATKLAQIHFPTELSGKSVLDIGAWDGFFSFEAEKRGARRVVAVDQRVWNVASIGKAGFEFARQALRSQVEDVVLDVPDVSIHRLGQFDLVLFLGVLYHLEEPFRLFQQVAAIAAQEIIVETHVDLVEVGYPAVAYYPFRECADDPSNWCGPNQLAMEGMLRLAGFRTIKSFPLTPVLYEVTGREPGTFGRMVFHASR